MHFLEQEGNDYKGFRINYVHLTKPNWLWYCKLSYNFDSIISP
jgi:hypothetical protein